MVFQRAGKRIFEFVLTHKDGRRATLSCGTDDARTAQAVEDAAKGYVRRRQWDVVALLVDKTITAPDLYDASEDGTLDEFLGAARAQSATVDVHPLVTEWHAWKGKAKKGQRSADAYETQLRRLFPADQPFPLSLLTKQTVWTRIDRLTVSAPTKKRYRAAVSSFVGWLVSKDYLATNFTRDLDAPTTGWDENDAREIYYEQADARRLIEALPQPYRGLEAYAYGFAAEWGAVATVRVRELAALADDPPQAFVPGTKTPERRRWVPLVPELHWLLPHLAEAIRNAHPDALAFEVGEKDALAVHYATAKAVNVQAVGERRFGHHTIRDWRHTHAVHVLQWKYDEMIAAKHLGHADVTLVRKVYGQWIPRAAEYAKRVVPSDLSGDLPSRPTRSQER